MCRISGLPSCESLYAHLLHIQSHLLENTSTNKDSFEIMLCRKSKGRSNSQPDQQTEQVRHRHSNKRRCTDIRSIALPPGFFSPNGKEPRKILGDKNSLSLCVWVSECERERETKENLKTEASRWERRSESTWNHRVRGVEDLQVCKHSVTVVASIR